METLKTMKTLVERKKESLMNVNTVIVTAADNRQYPFKTQPESHMSKTAKSWSNPLYQLV